MNAEPQKEHEWLHRLVGEWTYESEAFMEPGKPPEKFEGTESVRSVGGIWVVLEGRVPMPGGGMATTLMTLGYDPHKQHYVGTWIGSMMTFLWLYEGSLDAAERMLTLASDGPGPSGAGKLTRYRDEIAIESHDQRTLTSYMLGDDGNWTQIMTARYRRTQ